MIGSARISTWLPDAASTQAQQLGGTLFAVYVPAVLAVVLVTGLAIVFVRQFQRRRDDERGAPGGRAHPVGQALCVLAGLGLAGFAFVAGFPGFLDQTVAPYGAYPVKVTARQWGYDFTYPNGHLDDTLHVATGRPVKLVMTSADVVHSLQVPALAVNQAILPARTAEAWFEATVADTFDLRSGVYSGEGFAGMRSALIAHPPAEFDAWLQRVSDIFAGRTLEEVGELLYTTKGCKACHSLDGSRLIGPSFKDMYGHEFDTREGVRVTVDDAYVKESILTPNVSVIAGFEPVMTAFAGNITDREIEAVTAWLRTLSSRGGTATDPAAAGQEGN